MARRFSSDHPPPAEYEQTAKGKEPRGRDAGRRAARHVYKRARLVHADSGREVRLGHFRVNTGERVAGQAVHLERGSAATRRRRR